MNTISRTLSLSFFSIHLLFAQPLKAWSDDAHAVATTALAIGGAVAAGVGLYKLCDWAFSRSDEQVVADVGRYIAQGHADFDKGLYLIESSLSNIPDYRDYNYRIYAPDQEPLLYQLALMNFNVTTMSDYRSRLNSLIKVLVSEQSTLNRRLDSLSKKMVSNPSLSRMYATMNELLGTTTVFLGRMRFLHEYLVQHEHYFNLFDLESSLLKKYDQELVTLQRYGHDTYALTNLLRVSIVGNAGYKYPIMGFLTTIEASLNRLNGEINATGFDYPARLSSARALYQNLYTIYSLVKADPSYSQEVIAYEREKLEKQRLAIERQQLDAMREQNWHLQQQARELRRANDLKREEMARSIESCLLCDLLPCCCEPEISVHYYV